MKAYYKYLCAVLILTMSSCHNNNQRDNSLKVIDVENNIKSLQIMDLSKF